MLYLVRKLDESIIINNNIEVKVVEIKRNSVKLGFSFPASASVLRKEIHDRIAEENQASATSFDGDTLEVEFNTNDKDTSTDG